MSVRRRSNGSWIIDFRFRGQRYRKTKPGSERKRDVETFARRWLSELEQTGGRYATATVGDIVKRYFAERAGHLGDAKGQDYLLGLWTTALGPDALIVQVTADDISAVLAGWRNDADKRITDSSVNRRMAAIRACWRWAADVWGVPLASIPWRRMRLAEPEPTDRSVGKDARDRVMAAWPERSKAVAQLAFATGLRLGAILRLERRDIDLERRIIRTIGKGKAGGKENVVPITDEVRGIIDGLAMPDVGRLFPLSKFQVSRDRMAARKAAKLEDFRLHDARHDFAQELENAGQGHFITDALHHSSPALRRRYAHARQDVIREAIETARGHTAGTRAGKAQ